jgi:hypothetical protein
MDTLSKILIQFHHENLDHPHYYTILLKALAEDIALHSKTITKSDPNLASELLIGTTNLLKEVLQSSVTSTALFQKDFSMMKPVLGILNQATLEIEENQKVKSTPLDSIWDSLSDKMNEFKKQGPGGSGTHHKPH